MHGHNLVAVYQTRSDAERVRERLISEGFLATDIRLSGTPVAGTTRVSGREEPGFWAWLFGEVPEEERGFYSSHVQENRAVVSVRVIDEQRRQQALDIMEEFDPIDLGDQSRLGATSTMPQVGAAQRAGAGSATRTGRAQEEEHVIPVVKEELSVGKRTTERHHRVPQSGRSLFVAGLDMPEPRDGGL